MNDRELLEDFLRNNPLAQAAADQEAQARAAQPKRQRATYNADKQAFEVAPPKQPLKLIRASDVPYEEVRFLFTPYVPLGKITIVQGDSGVGKTAFVCKLAAAVTTGGLMQTVQCQKAPVLMISTEDDLSTLRGRVEASGGDLDQCIFVDRPEELTFMSEQVESLIKESRAKLVVFDPLQSFLGAKTDMFRANETRPVMAHLAAVAKKYECAIMIVSHLSKGSAGSKAIYRALGSVDIIAASRSVLYIGRTPTDDTMCAMVHVKCSNAPRGRSLLYRIGGRGGVSWEGYSDIKEGDLEKTPVVVDQGTPHEEEPLVQFLRVVVEENPCGVFLSWGAFERYAVCVGCEKVAVYDRGATRRRLKELRASLAARDGIYMEIAGTADGIAKQRELAHVEGGETVQPLSDYAVAGVRIYMRNQPEEVVL